MKCTKSVRNVYKKLIPTLKLFVSSSLNHMNWKDHDFNCLQVKWQIIFFFAPLPFCVYLPVLNGERFQHATLLIQMIQREMSIYKASIYLNS